jgi:hypothetical protein
MSTSTRAISPEQRLFVGVIVNAAQEAASGGKCGDSLQDFQQSARAWFKNDGDDFRLVCELAGFEPREVRRRVLDYLDRVEADPSAMARMKRMNADKRPRGVSIPDVARRARVSPTTVSNVIHHRPQVTPQTRACVLAAMKELGYSRHVN